MMALAILAALALRGTPAEFDLNGSWTFRFEEGKSIEQVARPDFAATDTMVVPGCYDSMPQWFLKRGTGLYRRSFSLDRPVENAFLVVDGMGLRGDFRIDGRPFGVHPYPYARLELPTGPLAAGEHMLFAALDNRTYGRNSVQESGKFHGISIAGLVNHQRYEKKACETVRKYFKMK